ncbi:Transcriptional regulator, TetR family [Klebsiella aerogenes]|nr:Transcriptional regulator, TetR family [Klebsiella aerogenes]
MSLVAHDEAQSLKERIFAAAITVFAEYGLPGARMEQIAIEAQTTKRMVVYYFKSKEQLYQGRYCNMCMRGSAETEQQLGLEHLPPVEALVQLVKWSVRYHATHADYMRELSVWKHAARQVVEGFRGAETAEPLPRCRLSKIFCNAASQQGIFQAGLQARDVHRLISSFSFYQVSNFSYF